jgi:hypothetical protein
MMEVYEKKHKYMLLSIYEEDRQNIHLLSVVYKIGIPIHSIFHILFWISIHAMQNAVFCIQQYMANVAIHVKSPYII